MQVEAGKRVHRRAKDGDMWRKAEVRDQKSKKHEGVQGGDTLS